jgi:hypothetical protein
LNLALRHRLTGKSTSFQAALELIQEFEAALAKHRANLFARTLIPDKLVGRPLEREFNEAFLAVDERAAIGR